MTVGLVLRRRLRPTLSTVAPKLGTTEGQIFRPAKFQPFENVELLFILRGQRGFAKAGYFHGNSYWAGTPYTPSDEAYSPEEVAFWGYARGFSK